jgi:glycine oxidase
MVDLLLASLRSYPAFVEELQSESGQPIDYRASGALELAFTEEEWRALQARSEAQHELGICSEELERKAVVELAPMVNRSFTSALYYPGDGVVDPRHVMRALVTVCRRAGVMIGENRQVHQILLKRDSVEVRNGGGSLQAGAAVLAAGAWSSLIEIATETAPVSVPASFPIRGHLLGYALEPRSLGPIVRHGPTYILQRATGYTVAGSSTERVGFNRCPDAEVIRDIGERAASLIPVLPRLPQPEAWTGFRPATDSFEPEIRPVPDTRLWLAYGHYRNGILLAPATAERVRSQITSSSQMGSF